MKELIKEFFNLWARKRWIKTIEKEVDKYNKASCKITKYTQKLNRHRFVVNKLVEHYNEIYKENLRGISNQGGAIK